jgi:hypothetical protein
MKVQQLLPLLFLLSLLSCKKETVTKAETTAIPAEAAAPVVIAETPKSSGDIIAKLINRKNEVTKQVKTLNHDEANALYLAYKQENDTLIMHLQQAEHNVLEKYYNYFTDEQGDSKTPPDSIQKKVASLSKAGLEFWEIGEGYVDIRTSFYKDIFKNYVSEDFKRFIELVAEEDKDLYSADAGLAISFKDVGKRVLHWEDFIKKHPYSKLMPQALELYREYQNGYLLGMDNTPTVDFETNKPYPENVAEFNSFIGGNPASYTTPLIKLILNFKGDKDELRTTIEKEQDKLIKKLTAETTPDYY